MLLPNVSLERIRNLLIRLQNWVSSSWLSAMSMAAKYCQHTLHKSDIRDCVEDYSGLKRLLCRSLLPFSKELLPLVLLSFFGFANPDYSEYIVDATLQKTDARAYLYGQAHQGFFESLFPTFSRLGLCFNPHGVSPLRISLWLTE